MSQAVPYVDLSLLGTEPEAEYHRQAGPYLSSHLLGDFRKSPLLYRKRTTGLIEAGDTPAYLLGRAVHVRVLEGRAEYDQRFARGGPINDKTGRPYGSTTRAWAEWAAAQGKPVLTEEQAALVEQIAVGVAMNDAAVDLIAEGAAERVVRTEYCGVPCQARLDWLHPLRGLVDLKTCDDLTWFEADARRYGYAHQMAFYRALLAVVLGGTLVPVHFIAVEKKEPFRCGVWRLSDDCLAQAQRENEAAIERLKGCDRRGEWPTGYEEVRLFDSL